MVCLNAPELIRIALELLGNRFTPTEFSDQLRVLSREERKQLFEIIDRALTQSAQQRAMFFVTNVLQTGAEHHA